MTVDHLGREWRTIARKNPKYDRPYLKPDDVVQVGEGVVILPDEVRHHDFVKQWRWPGEEWHDVD